MIAVTCLNPAFDRTLEIDALHPGEVHRVRRHILGAGGKGVNVAIVLTTLGLDARCWTFVGQENAALFERQLTQKNVATVCLPVPGEVRTNTKIVSDNSTVTELNEPGPVVTQSDLAGMIHSMQACTDPFDCLVLTGSLPPGCPVDAYRTMMESVAGPVFLDTSGIPLVEGLKGHPIFVKPNLQEMAEATGMPVASEKDIRKAAETLQNMGARNILLSLGEKGALLFSDSGIYSSPALSVPVRSTVGAGDAMVAGFLKGYLQTRDYGEALRMGTACGAASVMTEGTGLVRKADVQGLLQKAQVKRVG